MTKRQALEWTVEMWRWLAKNPGKDKNDYLALHKPTTRWNSECALCQYTVEHSSTKRRDCSLCPLLKFWGKFIRSEFDPCIHAGPYARWCVDKSDSVAAREIANAAQRRLKELK